MNAPHKPTGCFPTTLTLTPMTKAEAAALVKKMLGSYPSLNLHDPQTYIASVCTLLVGYPLWAGESAVRAITRESKFVPTQAEITEKLEDEVRVHRYAAEWDEGARQQLLALPAPKVSAEDRAAFIAKRRAELGPNFGLSGGKPRPPTQDEARAALIAEIGQEAFDAMPDADYDWKKLRAPPIAAEPDKARALAGTEGA